MANGARLAEFERSMTVIALSREAVVGDKGSSNLPLPTCPGVSPGIFYPLERYAFARATLGQFSEIELCPSCEAVAGRAVRKKRTVKFDSLGPVRRKSRRSRSCFGGN